MTDTTPTRQAGLPDTKDYSGRRCYLGLPVGGVTYGDTPLAIGENQYEIDNVDELGDEIVVFRLKAVGPAPLPTPLPPADPGAQASDFATQMGDLSWRQAVKERLKDAIAESHSERGSLDGLRFDVHKIMREML